MNKKEVSDGAKKPLAAGDKDLAEGYDEEDIHSR